MSKKCRCKLFILLQFPLTCVTLFLTLVCYDFMMLHTPLVQVTKLQFRQFAGLSLGTTAWRTGPEAHNKDSFIASLTWSKHYIRINPIICLVPLPLGLAAHKLCPLDFTFSTAWSLGIGTSPVTILIIISNFHLRIHWRSLVHELPTLCQQGPSQ